MNSLILGIDPGSTVGYAVLDLEGNLLLINSVRNFSISSIILEIKHLGKIVVVGTDVNPVPKFVSKFASNFGAKLVVPRENLLLKYKKKLAKKFLKNKKIKAKNKHQLDALAAALIAFKHYQPLFNKINNHLVQECRENIIKQVKTTVLIEQIPIKKAVEVCR